MNKRIIITLKEQSIDQTDKLVSFLNKTGVQNIKAFSTIGIIVGTMPSNSTRKTIEAHVDVEKVTEDKKVYIV